MTTTAPIHNEISQNVRSALGFLRLNQSDLARWLGIKPASASRLVIGSRPWSLDYLQVIADKLGVTVALLTGPTARLMEELERRQHQIGVGDQNLKPMTRSDPLPAVRLAA